MNCGVPFRLSFYYNYAKRKKKNYISCFFFFFFLWQSQLSLRKIERIQGHKKKKTSKKGFWWSKTLPRNNYRKGLKTEVQSKTWNPTRVLIQTFKHSGSLPPKYHVPMWLLNADRCILTTNSYFTTSSRILFPCYISTRILVLFISGKWRIMWVHVLL